VSVTSSLLILVWSFLAGIGASVVAIRFRPMTTNRTLLLLPAVLVTQAAGFGLLSAVGPHRHWVDYLWPVALLAGFLAYRLARRTEPFFGRPFVPAQQRRGRDLAQALAVWLVGGPVLAAVAIVGAASGGSLDNSGDLFAVLAFAAVLWIVPGGLTALWWAQGRTRLIHTYPYWFMLILVIPLFIPECRTGLTPPIEPLDQ
jgi:hypothetical protein